MKKIIISLITVVLVYSGVYATGNPNPPANPNNLYKHLQSEINYPRFARQTGIEGTVLVAFDVNADGYIQVKELNTSNEMLGQYVTQQLNSIRLCPFDLSTGKTFYMQFNFRLLGNK